MQDFGIHHITSVYALNCSEFSFMLVISEDRMDTEEKKSKRTKFARN